MNAKVEKAKTDLATARKEVDDLEISSKEKGADLKWWTKLYEFLKSGLKQQVTKQRDDLKALKQLADPKKDKCEVWFHAT